VMPLSSDVLSFVDDVNELISFLIQGVSQHGMLLHALEEKAHEAQTERDARVTIEGMLADSSQAQATLQYDLAHEIQQLRAEQHLIEKTQYADAKDEVQRLYNLHQLDTGGSTVDIEEVLAACRAEMEAVRLESAALKTLILTWEEHRGDVDYEGYFLVEMASKQGTVMAEIKHALSQNTALKIENAQLTATLDTERLDREQLDRELLGTKDPTPPNQPLPDTNKGRSRGSLTLFPREEAFGLGEGGGRLTLHSILCRPSPQPSPRKPETSLTTLTDTAQDSPRQKMQLWVELERQKWETSSKSDDTTR